MDDDIETNNETGTPLLNAGEGDLLALPFWSAPVEVTNIDEHNNMTLSGTSGGRYRMRPTPQGYEITRFDRDKGGRGAGKLPAHVAADDIEVVSPGTCLASFDAVPKHRKVYVGRNLHGKQVEIRSPDGELYRADGTVTKAGQVVCPHETVGEPVEIWFSDERPA